MIIAADATWYTCQAAYFSVLSFIDILTFLRNLTLIFMFRNWQYLDLIRTSERVFEAEYTRSVKFSDVFDY